MAPDEEEVRAAVQRFYSALDDMMSGKGLVAMRAAWHQGRDVTSGHPVGNWAVGWDEVLATWAVFEGVGRPAFAGSHIEDLRVFVNGDGAYSICMFVSAPALGSVRLGCTNVLRRVDGQWKIVHHHADKDAKLGAAMEKALAE